MHLYALVPARARDHCANGRAAIPPRELLVLDPAATLVTSLQCAVASARWLRTQVDAAFAAKIDRAILLLAVGHALEAMLATPKANFLEPLASGGTSGGQQAHQALSQLGAMLEGVGERHAADSVEPIAKLLACVSCKPVEFADTFGRLREAHPEVSAQVAEAVLSKRSGLSKAEQKELLARANAAAASVEKASPVRERRSSSTVDPATWEPDELAALWSAPFGPAATRLGGGKKVFKAKVTGLLSKMGGRRSSGDAPAPGMLHTRPRQVSGSL